jgi:SecD/SecF fusion protein
VLTALLVLGGDSLTGFASALVLGIVAGTVSTVSVAVPLTVAPDRRWPPPLASVAAARRTPDPRHRDGAVV